jgi:hypothetical protein
MRSHFLRKQKDLKYTIPRYFCDVVCCEKSDMDRLLDSPEFVSKLPAEKNGTGLYREDQVKKWFEQCVKDGFKLSKPLRTNDYQYYYGFR